MSTVPVADHALLSDCHGAALVTRAGSVDWLVFCRFDAPSVCARLLDDGAGHWAVHPAGPATATRRYVDGSMVLETTFAAGGGTLVLTDALAVPAEGRGHALGRGAPQVLVRRVACTEGEVDVVSEYAPRPEYGLIVPVLGHVDGGVTARGGAEWLVLSSPVAVRLEDGVGEARFRLRAGETCHLALHRSTVGDVPARVWDQDALAALLDGTVDAWRSWSALHQAYEGPWRDLVRHSGRVLQALTFQPTGAVVAAATTSLPEDVGGERNWDYRYAWVRDASFTMDALWVAACPDEAQDFFAFLCTAAAASLGAAGADLQIVFGVAGEHDLSERTLDHLDGWRGSRPVRVGNGAWRQRQIDVYGELLGAAERLSDQLDGLDDETRAFLVAAADVAAVRWRETDQGIWEVRGEPRHFLYSKVMCWVALDRAIALADRLGAPGRVPAWARARDEIHAYVLAEGWSDEAGAFTQYVGGTTLDASNLMMPIVGFLPADDPRVRATVERVAEGLVDARGLVSRYDTTGGVDGLAGEEGSFLLCTFWLAQAFALAGEVDRATAVFTRAAAYVSDVGLLAEEVDGATGELLGNVPQAFSHIGLVNAAWAIHEARGRRAVPAQGRAAPDGGGLLPDEGRAGRG